jgi:NAD(P)-dependent dehydrogenase (short-subunit alcohol dehydrogenase family)
MTPGVVIVTGGTFGIGFAITVELARRGWQVVAFGLDAPQPSSIASDGSEMLRDELASIGASADILEADVSKEDDVHRVVSHTIEKYNRIDALVNNAAIGPLGDVPHTSKEIWDRVLSINLSGPFMCCKQVLPHMISNGGGAIVNICSGAAWGKPNMAAYSASKGGLMALSMAMAHDHLGDRVRVNIVIPGGGGIVTGMSVGRVGGDVDKIRQRPVRTAAGRSTTPQDVANVVAFLLSNEATVISGTVVDVGCFAHQGGQI